MRFNDLLEAYIQKKIDEKSLYNDVRQIFCEYLDEHRFRELEYLKIYPFISWLQDEDIYQESILMDEINNIEDILNGKKAFSYGLWMCLENCDIGIVHSVFNEYKENGKISIEEQSLLELKLLKSSSNIKTIWDVCLEKLLNMLVELPTLDDDFYAYNMLYSGEIDKSTICEEIELLIEILEGKRAVYITLLYTDKGFCCII